MLKVKPKPEALMRTRIISGFSRGSFAKHAGITEETIRRIEEGMTLYPATAKKICDALQADFDLLFQLEG